MKNVVTGISIALYTVKPVVEHEVVYGPLSCWPGEALPPDGIATLNVVSHMLPLIVL